MNSHHQADEAIRVEMRGVCREAGLALIEEEGDDKRARFYVARRAADSRAGFEKLVQIIPSTFGRDGGRFLSRAHRRRVGEPESFAAETWRTPAQIVGFALRVDDARRVSFDLTSGDAKRYGVADGDDRDVERTLIAELGRVRSALAETETGLEFVERSRERLAAEKAELARQLDGARSELSRCRTANETTNAELDNVRGRLELANEAIAKQREKFDDVDDRLAKTIDEREHAKRSLAIERRELCETLDTLKRREVELAAARVDLETAQRKEVEAKERAISLGRTIDDLRAELDRVRDERDDAVRKTAASVYSNLRGEIDEANASLSSKSLALEGCGDRVRELERKVGELDKKLALVRSQRNDENKRANDAGDSLRKASSDVAALASKVQELEKKLAAATEQGERLSLALHAADEDRRRLSSDLERERGEGRGEGVCLWSIPQVWRAALVASFNEWRAIDLKEIVETGNGPILIQLTVRGASNGAE